MGLSSEDVLGALRTWRAQGLRAQVDGILKAQVDGPEL